jgi:glycerophosphoryl diester phosphodiesterase
LIDRMKKQYLRGWTHVSGNISPLNLAAASRGGRPLVCGHRGARTVAPENTIASFDLALEKGAGIIELDVQLTRDGGMAIIHDHTVDRTTDGTGRVADLSWDELQVLDAGIRFGEAFRGQRVPSLLQVLEWARGRVYLAVEVKEPYPVSPDVLKRIASVIKDAGMADQVTMHHIPQPDISIVHNVDPAIKVVCDWVVTIRDAKETIVRTQAIGGAGVIWDIKDSTVDNVAAAHAAGLAVYAYDCPTTVEAARAARECGVDIIEADDVEAMANAAAAGLTPQ